MDTQLDKSYCLARLQVPASELVVGAGARSSVSWQVMLDVVLQDIFAQDQKILDASTSGGTGVSSARFCGRLSFSQENVLLTPKYTPSSFLGFLEL